MKAKSAILIMTTFFLTASSAYAVEQLAVETALNQAEMHSEKMLPLLVTGQDELILKPGTVFSEGGHHEGTELPYLISNPEPVKYPRWALRQGWQGDLSIAIEITKDGNVGRYKVMHSTGHAILDETATHAVHGWKFHPAMKNGEAIVTCIQIPVRFQINNQE